MKWQLKFLQQKLYFFKCVSFSPCLSSSEVAVHNRCLLYKITTSDIWSYHKCAGCGHIFETQIIFADEGIRFCRPHNFLSAFHFINSWNGYMFPSLSPGYHQILFYMKWPDDDLVKEVETCSCLNCS